MGAPILKGGPPAIGDREESAANSSSEGLSESMFAKSNTSEPIFPKPRVGISVRERSNKAKDRESGNAFALRRVLVVKVNDSVSPGRNSRAVAGYFLSFEDPSALHTSLALRQAIWRKEDSRWIVCGIPDVLYTDNDGRTPVLSGESRSCRRRAGSRTRSSKP